MKGGNCTEIFSVNMQILNSELHASVLCGVVYIRHTLRHTGCTLRHTGCTLCAWSVCMVVLDRHFTVLIRVLYGVYVCSRTHEYMCTSDV